MTLLPLSDGRVLEIESSGPPDGVPMIFHHGTPGSGFQRRALQEACAQRGLRLVTYSRPGYGESTRHPGRRVADVAADIEVLLDHLAAPRALVGGWSGGGPHALACAALLPDRIAAALTVAGLGPYRADGLDFLSGMGEQNIEEFNAALSGEAALRPALQRERVGLMATDAAAIIEALHTLLPPVDRAVVTDEFGADLITSFHQGLRHGVDGWVDDDLAFVQPWGFELAELRVPVFVWQGSEDLMVPFAHGRWLAERIPSARGHLEPGLGHLSVEMGRLGESLDELVATLPG